MNYHALFAAIVLGGFSVAAHAQSAAGSGANHGMASPGGNPGAGAASGPVISPSSGPAAAVEADGVVRRGAIVYLVKNGEELRVQAETQLANGMTVDRLGKVTFKDGRSVELRDGQMARADGRVSDAPR